MSSSETKTAPALRPPVLEPVPVDGCRICGAAANGRAWARCRGNAGGVRNYNSIISQHPHRRAADWKGSA